MIEKSDLGETGTGDLPIISPTLWPLRHQDTQPPTAFISGGKHLNLKSGSYSINCELFSLIPIPQNSPFRRLSFIQFQELVNMIQTVAGESPVYSYIIIYHSCCMQMQLKICFAINYFDVIYFYMQLCSARKSSMYKIQMKKKIWSSIQSGRSVHLLVSEPWPILYKRIPW